MRKGVDPAKIRVTLGVEDVTRAFALRANGRFEGLLDGPGGRAGHAAAREAPRAARGDARRSSTTRTAARSSPARRSSRGSARTARTTRSATADDLHVPATSRTDRRVRRPTTRRTRRRDVATTTTDQGKTVPFIVRIETGYQDRDQYQIAVLYDPAKPWTPWAPQPQFNHKLLITHGASCGIDHQSGTRRAHQRHVGVDGVPGEQQPDDGARRAASRSCRPRSTTPATTATSSPQAESLVMAKEHLVEQLRRAALHDRHRLLGRLARPAAGRQRLPRHLPGDPAAVQLPGRVVDRPAARRLPPDPPLRRGPVEVGARRGLDAGLDRPRSRATRTTSTRSSSTRVYWTDLGVPDDGCAGVPAEQDYNAADEPRRRALHARGLHDQRVRPAPASVWGRPRRSSATASPGCRSTTSACSTASKALKKGMITPGPVRRPEREDRRRRHRHQPDAEQRIDADRAGAARAYRSGGDQRRRTT